MKFVLLACVLGCALLPARGDVYVDSLDVAKYQGAKDTMWIVNKGFTGGENQTRHVELKLLLKNTQGLPTTGQVTCQQINIQTGAKTDINTTGWPLEFSQLSDTLKFPSLDEGVYLLHFAFDGSPSKLSCYLFNQRLEFQIIDALVSEGNVQGDDCITGKEDTCYFTLRDHRFNPAGTEYAMDVNDDFGGDVKVDKKKDSRDTFFIVFSGPTGINELRVAVKGSYKDERDGREITRTITRERTLQKYATPDLARIFGFDTLSSEHLSGCANNGPLAGLSFGKDMGERYMYANNEPDFCANPKLKYTIKYYRRDFEHDEAGNPIAWSESHLLSDAQKKSYISDSVNISFLESGVYRVWMTAENRCGKDTLDTKVIFDENTNKPIIANPDTGRLIKIYRNDTKDLVFRQSSLCLVDKGGGVWCDTLVVKDGARYLDWEGKSKYEFFVKQIIKSADGKESIVELPEEDISSYYRMGGEKSFLDDVDKRITDSVVMKMVFYRPGTYQVVVKKKRENALCAAEVTDSLRLRVGAAPSLKPEILYDANGAPKENQTLCGIYEYIVPQELKADSNNYEYTAFEWKFGKGKYEKTSDKRFPDFQTFVFDSLNGAHSYIKLRLQNRCGWSEEASVNFSVHKALNVQLWIDSIPNNDTLCVGREYKYHFKGELPERFQIYGFGDSETFATDSIIKYAHTTPERFNNTYIVKDANSSCEQRIEAQIDFIAPPAFTFGEIVDFCSTTQEIKTSLLLKNQPDELEHLVYKRMHWKAILPETLSLIEDEDLNEELQKDFPKFTVSGDEKTILYYWITVGGGGDYSRYQGCYDTGRIELTRRLVPTFQLKDEQLADLCAKQINTTELFGQGIAGASSWTIQVNEMSFSGNQGDPLPEYTVTKNDDSIKMKVSAVIDFDHPYLGESKCEASDAVAVDIRNPRIRILKNDTLYASDRIYRFEQIKDYVDTADIINFKWISIDSDNRGTINNPNDLFEATCDFSKNTSNSEYRFELYGESLCDNGILRDTLHVWIPLIGFTGGSVSICDNNREYPLWSDIADGKHINGYFIDESTLTYYIKDDDGKKGTIVGSGKQAAYRLPEHWEGELATGRGPITIIAEVNDENGVVLEPAKLNIYIDHAPRMSLKDDIVLSNGELILADGDALALSSIADFPNAGANIKWYHGDMELDGNEDYLPNYKRFVAYKDSIYVEIPVHPIYNKGCNFPFYDTLALWIHPQPRVVFRKSPIGVCPNNQVAVAPKEPFAGDGEPWQCQWTSQLNSTVGANASLSIDYEYVDGSDLGFDTLSLTITKQVTNYKNELKTLTAKDTVVVINYRKPEILGEDAMICSSETEIDIREMKIRTPYDNPLSFVSQAGLEPTSDPKRYHFTGEAGTTANLTVSLKEQVCPDWAVDSKVFSIRRLPELKATLSVEPVSLCDGDSFELKAEMGNGVTKYEWRTTQGGKLDNADSHSPKYLSQTGIAKDTVVLTLSPELERCTDDKREYRVPVQVGTVPHDLWKTEFSICATEKHFSIRPNQATEQELQDIFSKIEWMYNGKVFSAEFIPEFDMSLVDSRVREGDKSIVITAKAWLACNPDREAMSIDMKVNIAPVPKVTVGTMSEQLCQGQSLSMDFVTFKDASTWQWSASHGRFSNETDENPVYYPDEYFGADPEIKVVVGNGGACSDMTEYVRIGEIWEAPKPGIQAGPACQGKEMRIWSSAEHVETYIWRCEGDEQADPVAYYTFDDLADHSIVLEVKYTNGCIRQNEERVSVHENPVAKLNVADTLVGILHPVQIESLSDNNLQLRWYIAGKLIGKENSFPYTFLDAGKYKITLEVENEHGCTHAVDTIIRVIGVLKPDFTVKLADKCDTVPQFENLTSVPDKYDPKYTWLLGTEDLAPDVDIHGEVPGGIVRYVRDWKRKLYNVGLVVETIGGKDTAWKQLEIESRLKASILQEDQGTLCSGKEYLFRNQTKGFAERYRISWGDGQDSTFAGKGYLKHVYTNESFDFKKDTVRLYAENACFKDMDSVVIVLNPRLRPWLSQVTGQDICFGEELVFANKTERLNDLAVFWDFGDGSLLEENNSPEVAHVFKKPGNYRVTMTIEDQCGEREKDTKDVHIKGDISLAFNKNVSVVCSERAVDFQVMEAIKNSFYQYEWCLNYAQASAANTWEPDAGEAKITHQWAGEKKTIVALKAKSLDGCQSIYADTIEVKKTTPAHWEFRYGREGTFLSEGEEIYGCSPLELEVKALGTKPTDMVRWDFYDGASSSDKQIMHTYRDAGNTFVKLSVTTRDGCTDSLKKEVTVKRTPQASFTNVPGNIFCVDGVVRLEVENGSTSAGDTTYSWSYLKPGAKDFAAWSDAFLPPVMEWEEMFGEIVLRLRTAWGGCGSEYCDTIISSPAPENVVAISATGVCEEAPVEFYCEALPGSRFSWNLGDHSPERADSVFVYRYDDYGQYPVTLHIENRYGCVKDTAWNFTVYPLPEADFDFVADPAVIEDLPEGVDISQLPVVNNGGFRFTNHSVVPALPFADGTLFPHWDMGDGTILNVDNPTHRFSNNGNYSVELLVKTPYGCVDSLTQVVSVEEVKGLYIPNAFAPIAGKEENPGIALFQPKGIGLLSYEIRIFDNPSGTCVWKSSVLEDGRPAEAWDGTFNGQPLPGKVYLWEVKAVFRDGSIWKDEKGNTRGMVTLVR